MEKIMLSNINRQRAVIALLASALCATAFADHGHYVYDVVPGSQQVDTSRLVPYRARWQQFSRSEEGLTDSGVIYEETLVLGDRTLHHTQVVRQPNGTKATEQRTFDRSSLRPERLTRSLVNAPQGQPKAIELDRKTQTWSGTATMSANQQHPFEYTSEADAFDGWVAGLVLASLPLKTGYEAKLPALVQLQQATYLLHAKVVGQRKFKPARGPGVQVWIVDTDWINVTDGSVSPGGAKNSGGSYLIARNPGSGQPHVIEYANNGVVIRWAPHLGSGD